MIIQTSKNYSSDILFSWIELGQSHLGTHPYPSRNILEIHLNLYTAQC